MCIEFYYHAYSSLIFRNFSLELWLPSYSYIYFISWQTDLTNLMFEPFRPQSRSALLSRYCWHDQGYWPCIIPLLWYECVSTRDLCNIVWRGAGPGMQDSLSPGRGEWHLRNFNGIPRQAAVWVRVAWCASGSREAAGCSFSLLLWSVFFISFQFFFFVESLVWYEEKISFFFRGIYILMRKTRKRERDAQLYYISRLGRQEFF